METEKIKEGNRVIAEFMGMKRHNHASYITWEHEKGKHIFESVLQYNSSWDWLMPVVEKIESLGYIFAMQSNTVVITSPKSKKPHYKNLYKNDGIKKIECVFIAIVAFINWYNQNFK